MEAKALLRYVRIAPRKIRMIVDVIRGQQVEAAFKKLQMVDKGSKLVVEKILKSAVANASQTGNMDVDKLYVSKAYVDQGPTLKRFMPRAMRRATQIQKKTSHITIVVAERE